MQCALCSDSMENLMSPIDELILPPKRSLEDSAIFKSAPQWCVEDIAKS